MLVKLSKRGLRKGREKNHSKNKKKLKQARSGVPSVLRSFEALTCSLMSRCQGSDSKLAIPVNFDARV